MPDLVVLDQDHPGFRDHDYRARRNAIAGQAIVHVRGEAVRPVQYTPEEQGVWRVALEKLGPLHDRYACDSYRAAWPGAKFSSAHVPDFEDVNAILAQTTGFRLEPVAGLVSPRQFMEALADGVFLATQYMRHHSMPLYTPEPDVIHELVGHVPLLLDPEFADLNRAFGLATRAAHAETIAELISVYWYALEFGVVESGSGKKVIGAGLLSSFGELGGFEERAGLRPFVLSEVRKTPFDPTQYQDQLFVGASVEFVLAEVRTWLEEIIRG